MRHVLLTLVTSILLGCSPSASDTFSEGMAAYQNENYATAFPLISNAAQQGDVNAMAIFGVMHLFGHGTPVNGLEAEKWLRRASDTGFTGAQSTLGIMYATGVGVERDLGEAQRLLKLAAEKGDKHAIAVLEQISTNKPIQPKPGKTL